jgi:hypothetical protein
MRYFLDSVLGHEDRHALQSERFFLFYDDTVAPRDYTKELPTDYVAVGQGFVVGRSDWSRDATLATFQCTNRPMDHTHPDQASFMLYRKGWWLTKEFTSYGGWGGRPEAHNVMLLWNLGPPRPDARIVAFKPTENYVYAVGSASGAHRTHGYQPPKAFVKSYTRSMLYLKPDLLVILDRSELLDRPDRLARPEQYVQTSGAGGPEQVQAAKYSREFLLHLPGTPELSEGASLITMNYPEAKQVLYAKTLLPREVACDVVNLKETFARTLGETPDAGNPPVERTFLVKTRAVKDPEGADVFLTVLYATDAGQAMIPLKLIEKDTRRGLEATVGTTTYTVLFSTAGEDAAHVKIERAGRAVCDDELPAKIDWTPPWKRR